MLKFIVVVVSLLASTANSIPAFPTTTQTAGLLKDAFTLDGRTILQLGKNSWYVLYLSEEDPRRSYQGHLTEDYLERGTGILRMKDGKEFDGEFFGSDRFTGKVKYPEGDRVEYYEGSTRYYKPCGFGSMKKSNGESLKGEFVNGIFNGFGLEKVRNRFEGKSDEGLGALLWDIGKLIKRTFTSEC